MLAKITCRQLEITKNWVQIMLDKEQSTKNEDPKIHTYGNT
jgi:hypothetical protein